MSAQEVELQSQFIPKGRITRQYSQTERAHALALYDNVGSLEKVSQTLNIPLSTIAGWARDPTLTSTARSQKSLELAEKIENAAHLYLELATKKAKKAEFHHLMSGFGIAIDKMQLMRGLPTSITENVDRQELTLILENSLNAIDVTPE